MKTPMSKAWTPKAPLLTPEALQALSTQEFASVRELIEAEDQRRITATPLTYVTPGPRILTPEGAAECAREGGLSARSEWLVALFMSNRHEVLARYRIYVGHSCPLPRELALDMDAVFKTAKACQAERIMLVRHHAHPLMLPSLEELAELDGYRHAANTAGTPVYDYVMIDPQGALLSIRDQGRRSQMGAQAGGGAADA